MNPHSLFLGWLNKNKAVTKRRPAAQRFAASLSIEHLEARQLLSAANPAPVGAAPVILSIVGPSKALTTPTAEYTVTFSENVTGVDPTDFAVIKTGTAVANNAVTVTPVSGSVYKVTVSGIGGKGTVGINFIDDASVKNSANSGLIRNFSMVVKPATVQSNLTQAFTVADFNNDTFNDVVVVDSTGQALLLKGKGDGTFQTPVTITGLTAPKTLIAADMDNDGKQDLITEGPGGFGLLKGKGDGTFESTAMTPGATASPTQLEIVDLNDDGVLDVVAATTASFDATKTQIVVYQGPQFGQVLSYLVDGTLGAIKTADLNGDGDPELLIATQSNTKLTVFDGSPNGLAPASTLPTYYTGRQTDAMDVADVNEDGKLDVILTSRARESQSYPGGLAVLLGKGDSTFQLPKNMVETNIVGLKVADVNGDGHADVVTSALFGSPGYGVRLGFGDGTYIPNAKALLAERPDQKMKVTGPIILTDLNNDGKPDLVSVDGKLFVGLNTSKGIVVGPQTKLGKIAVNAPPTAAPQTFTVPEKSANKTVVGTVAATDPDAKQKLTYSITAGNTGNVFTIDSKTGKITVANGAALVFATTPSYVLTVEVKDSGKPSLSTTAQITINVQQSQTVGPAVVSLARLVNTPITDFSTDYLVTFDKPVSGVTASNFAVVVTGGVSANPTVEVTKVGTGDLSTQWKITINVIERFNSGGTLGLNLIDPTQTIRDANNKGLGANFTFVGQVYNALP